MNKIATGEGEYLQNKSKREFDLWDDFCYFGIMLDEKTEKAKKYLQTGGIVAAIIAVLITLFLNYLYKYTFICLDPEICERIKEPMLQMSD